MENRKTPNKGALQKEPAKITTRRSSRRSQTPSLRALENLGVDEEDVSPAENIRRSNRKLSPSKRYENDFITTTTPNRSSNRKRRTINYEEERLRNIDENDTDTIEFYECEEYKDEIVIITDDDVAGKNLYGFSTPRKKDALKNIVQNIERTPKTPIIPKTPRTPNYAILKTPKSSKTPSQDGIKTPKSSKTPSQDVMKTPRTPKTPGTLSKRFKELDIQSKTPSRVRNKLKKEIIKNIQQELESDDDFSIDGSDYSPSQSESESSENEKEKTILISSEEDEKMEEIEVINKRNNKKITPTISKTPVRSSTRKKAQDYIPESEEYFITHANKKIVTSDHTLDKLKNTRIAPDQLFSLLSEMKISSEHEKSIKNLFEDYKQWFPKWILLMNEGYNICCYGLGSKRKLFQSFHKEFLSDEDVVVINGFFPSLTIKDILNGIIVDVIGSTNSFSNPHDSVSLIEETLTENPQSHIFLIVNNIDGPMLRNAKAQEVLSRLAKITNLHLIVSIDHINAPLLWDNVKLSNYNFVWFDTTTMLSYTEEISYENSLLVQNTGDLALSSMRSVFLSLTTNSKGIYMLIVKHQLRHGKFQSYQGMSFKDLYHACREAFLVSSDLALRAQLTEFIDHKLVRNKRNIDGTEFLQIPIQADLLQQFVNEQESGVQ